MCTTLPVSVLLGADVKVLYELIKQSWVEGDGLAEITNSKAKELHLVGAQEAERNKLEASQKYLNLSDNPLVKNGHGIMEEYIIPGP